MRLRYKQNKKEFDSSRFNPIGMSEILTGDGSVFTEECDIFINNQWKDLGQAFRDHDIITDNHDTIFFIPRTPKDKERGFTLS